MTNTDQRVPVRPGERAPGFALPAVNRDGAVSITDFRGRSPFLLALFRGLYCPFCRRNVAQLGLMSDKLKAIGVESLGVVATAPENARLYFRYRPTRLSLAADPDFVTHRAYGLPRPPVTDELMRETSPVNATGELAEPLLLVEVVAELEKRDGHVSTEVDRRELEQERQFPQLGGQFLIDREGHRPLGEHRVRARGTREVRDPSGGERDPGRRPRVCLRVPSRRVGPAPHASRGPSRRGGHFSHRGHHLS
jgi:peroxiredoxin